VDISRFSQRLSSSEARARFSATALRLCLAGLLIALGIEASTPARVGATTLAPQLVLVQPVLRQGSVETATGSGFAAHEVVVLTLNGVRLVTTPVSVTTTGGTFKADFVTPPTLHVGANIVAATGVESRVTASAAVAGATGAVTPAATPVPTAKPVATATATKTVITAVPAAAYRGAAVTVSGAGFAPGEPVEIYFTAVAAQKTPATANAAGLLPATSVLVPYVLMPGAHHLTAVGATSKRSSTVLVDVVALVPRVTLGRAVVAAGQTETLTGSGFGSHEQVVLTLNGVRLVTTPIPVVTTAGAFTASFVVPPTLKTGPNAIQAVGVDSRATQAATVVGATVPPTPAPAKAAIAVVPTAAYRGGAVTVSGAGFAPNEQVQIYFTALMTMTTPAVADANGLLAATSVPVPYALTAGVHHLTAAGTTSKRSSTVLVSVLKLVPHLSLGRAAVSSGQVETVTGSGFGAHESVALTLNGVAVVTNPTAIVATGGAFAASFVVPTTLRSGPNTVAAVGVQSGVTASAVTIGGSVAPPPPFTKTAITAVPLTVNRGGLVTVSGAGFLPGERIELYFSALPALLTPALADAGGLLPSTGVSVPYALGAGAHHLMARGVTSKRTASTVLTVLTIAPRITLDVSSAKPGDKETVVGSGFGTSERVTLALNGAALDTVPPVVTTINGSFTASFIVPTRLLDGANTVSAVGNGSRVTAVAPLTGTLPTAARFYFAGGENTASEHSFINLLNTHNEPATVSMTFYFDNGSVDKMSTNVPAHGKRVISVAGYNFTPGTFGLSLEANRSVSAQIAINRDGKDGDSLLGNTGLGTRWFLAEGFTGLTFHESVSVLNVANVPASVQLQILPLGGGPAKTVTVTAAPHSNLVTDINALEPSHSVSIIATSSTPVVVERTMTFSSNGYGLTTSAGSNTPATSWLFAEGTTSNRFQTFLTILNPNAIPANVTASFFDRSGVSLGSRTILVPALSRANIKENDFLSASGIASVVTSNEPVVVERPEYFGSPNDSGIAGSDVFGQNGAAVRTSFPDGDTHSTDEYLLIYNPSAVTVPIDVRFYGANGATIVKRIDVAPSVRYNVNVNTFAAGFDPVQGASLQSVSGLGFVAEQTVFAPDHSTLRSTAALAQ